METGVLLASTWHGNKTSSDHSGCFPSPTTTAAARLRVTRMRAHVVVVVVVFSGFLYIILPSEVQ